MELGYTQESWDYEQTKDQTPRAEVLASDEVTATKSSIPGLGIFAIALFTVMCGSGLSITGKKMGNALPEHMFAILLVAVFLISAAFFAAAYIIAGSRGIDKTTLAFPKKKYAIMAVFDTVQMTLTMLAQPHVPGKIQGLLGKTNIPQAMLLEWGRGKAVALLELLGAVMIVSGALVGLLYPMYFGEDQSGSTGALSIFWCGVYFCSTIPMVLGVTYKQVVLEEDIDENFMNGWTALFQAAFTILLLPLQLVLEEIPGDQLLPKLGAGMQCIGGDTAAGANCSLAWCYVGVWLFFLFMYNATMTSLVKHAGAPLMLAVSLLVTPVTNIAYSLPMLMGEHAEPISGTNVAGLVLTVCGILVYKLPAYQKPKQA